jgi:hypothetical protein
MPLFRRLRRDPGANAAGEGGPTLGEDPDWSGYAVFIASQDEVDRLAGTLKPSG